MVKLLPRYPHLEYGKKQAKRLLKAVRKSDPDALALFRRWHPRDIGTFTGFDHIRLADAQLVIAREYGFASWSQYKQGILMAQQSVFDTAVVALINGEITTLQTLLAQHPDLVNARSTVNGATLLHYVSANGIEDHYQKTPANALDIARTLFDAGADPNVTADIYGGGSQSTPLVCLVSSAHPHRAGVQADLVQIYLEHGAKPNGIADDGRPLSTALDHWYPQAFEALVTGGARLNNVVYAAAAGDQDAVATMLASETIAPYIDARGTVIVKRADIMARALIKASLCGQLTSVAQLHEHGVDLNSVIDHQRGALHEAAWTGQVAVIDYLLKNGADPSQRDTQFHSLPVQWAYFANQTAAFEHLLPASPLTVTMAAQFGLRERLNALLDSNPHQINEDEGAPLRAAIAYRHVAIVADLLQRGASLEADAVSGQSPLDLARRINHLEIIDLLEAHTAD